MRNKNNIIYILLSLILIVAMYFIIDTTTNQNNNTNGDNVNQENISNTDGTESDLKIDLGEGLKLIKLESCSSNFPEDGSDEYVENMVSATFVNEGETTLQYAKIIVTINETEYIFEISTIPVGQKVVAFNMEKLDGPDEINKIEAKAEYLAFFDKEPKLYSKKLKVTVNDGYITVKNVSEKAITKEVSIYYKNKLNENYFGGITYRVRIDGLEPGEEISGFSSHAQKNSSEVMFITYGN